MNFFCLPFCGVDYCTNRIARILNFIYFGLQIFLYAAFALARYGFNNMEFDPLWMYYAGVFLFARIVGFGLKIAYFVCCFIYASIFKTVARLRELWSD